MAARCERPYTMLCVPLCCVSHLFFFSPSSPSFAQRSNARESLFVLDRRDQRKNPNRAVPTMKSDFLLTFVGFDFDILSAENRSRVNVVKLCVHSTCARLHARKFCRDHLSVCLPVGFSPVCRLFFGSHEHNERIFIASSIRVGSQRSLRCRTRRYLTVELCAPFALR